MKDVFVRDLWTGTTTLASLNSSGSGSGNSNSYSPALSTDGRWLMFRSQARNLVSGSFTGLENLFARDMQSATTVALTTGGVTSGAMTPDGRFVAFVGSVSGVANLYLYVWDSALSTRVFTNTTANLSDVAISPDGNRIAFSSPIQLRIADRAMLTNWVIATVNTGSHFMPCLSADGDWLSYARSVTPWNQVYLYGVQNRTEVLVSHALNSAANGGGHSDSPDLTPDGRFVVYRTLATNIVAGANGITRQIILYDRQTGLNTLVSANRDTGMPGDDHSLRARFSADGQTLLLQSWASDLVANDFNRNGDVFAEPIFTAMILPPANPGQGPWLYWPSVSGNNYGVQFKSRLDDPDWQPAIGIMTNAGNKIWFQDNSATNSQRFYRVWSN